MSINRDNMVAKKIFLLAILFTFGTTFSIAQSVMVFDIPGTYTFTVPAGCQDKLTIAVYGAGGGGGGSDDPAIAGGGGGAGGFAQIVVNASPGDMFTYTVGKGGNGGAVGGDGMDGEISSCLGLISSDGGKGGKGDGSGSAGGLGGSSSGSSFLISGLAGFSGASVFGGNGGTNLGPIGGLGGAGGGANIDGSIGVGIGAGGGGGGIDSGTSTNGGNGTNGAVVFTIGVVYKTIASGDWDDVSVWDENGIAPTQIQCGEYVFIDHYVELSDKLKVLGQLMVSSNGTIDSDDDIDVGKGALGEGVIINEGVIYVEKLKIEPSHCIAAPDSLPIVFNNSGGVIIAEDEIVVGANCGSGSLYNDYGAHIYAEDFHIDGYVCNKDSIFIEDKTHIHGGTVDCCGYLETQTLKADDHSGRPAVSICQQYCSPDCICPPILDLAGSVVSSTVFLQGAQPTELLVDPILTTFCPESALPVELVDFVALAADRKVHLYWTTLSETNNDYFEIERSLNGENWEFVDIVFGAGNSNDPINYTYKDHVPYFGVSYYRLKQVDYDSKIEYSVVRSVDVNGNIGVQVFPNPTQNDLFVQIDSDLLDQIAIFDLLGRNLINLVAVTELGDNLIHIDVSSLAHGIYELRTGESTEMIQKQ